ncbi:MAG: N-acetyltransferase [Candidatus Electrothrix sp. AR4]|nr:N-acetyltransferase [Candidatus Electrothrix sp. AR4]
MCFSCGVPSLDDWLRNQALKNEVSGASRTYVVCTNVQVIAFYSFTTGSVACVRTPGEKPFNPVPVVVLGRLAVDSLWQGTGIGFGLLKDAVVRTLYVAQKIDVRALLVHALNEQIKNFYARYGFTELTIDPMILSLPSQTFAKMSKQPHRHKH